MCGHTHLYIAAAKRNLYTGHSRQPYYFWPAGQCLYAYYKQHAVLPAQTGKILLCTYYKLCDKFNLPVYFKTGSAAFFW